MINCNEATGFPYGVIAANSIPELTEKIFCNGVGATEDDDEACITYEYAEPDPEPWRTHRRIEDLEKIKVQLQGQYLFVLASPFVTMCRPCSPCFPNAGDLESPAPGIIAHCLAPGDMPQGWNGRSRRLAEIRAESLELVRKKRREGAVYSTDHTRYRDKLHSWISHYATAAKEHWPHAKMLAYQKEWLHKGKFHDESFAANIHGVRDTLYTLHQKLLTFCYPHPETQVITPAGEICNAGLARKLTETGNDKLGSFYYRNEDGTFTDAW